MSAFPPTAWALASGFALVASTITLAFLATRIRSVRVARYAAWAVVGFAVLVANTTSTDQPPGFRMLLLVTVLFLAMKGVVTIEARSREGTILAPARWLAFTTLWPGMQPALFASAREGLSGARPHIARGSAYLGCGMALVALALAMRRTGPLVVPTMAFLAGASLILHFGIFGVLTGMLRAAGFDVMPPFRAPLRAASLTEFWGRRWNVAFSEMTTLAVYRPVSRSAGRPAGLLAAFALSGIFHEIALSLPVRAGFGGPFLYFAIHGVLTLAERRHGPFGRAATLASVLLPLPMLFHPPFLRGVVWPLLG